MLVSFASAGALVLLGRKQSALFTKIRLSERSELRIFANGLSSIFSFLAELGSEARKRYSILRLGRTIQLPVEVPILAKSGQRLHIEVVSPRVALVYTIVVAGVVWRVV